MTAQVEGRKLDSESAGDPRGRLRGRWGPRALC